MLLFPLEYPRRIRHEKFLATQAAPPPPPAPLLVSALYDESGPTLTLGFDRAVNIDGFDGAQIVVQDQPNAWQLVGTSAQLLDALTVQVVLLPVDTASGYAVLLDASGATGIVAADDAAAWAGVDELQLPFP